jgi:hypothetical protein
MSDETAAGTTIEAGAEQVPPAAVEPEPWDV